MKKFYSLIAVAALASVSFGQEKTIIDEGFSFAQGIGANDGIWNSTAGSGTGNTIADGVHASGFSFIKSYAANSAIKLGTGSAKGEITSPAFTGIVGGNATVTFQSAAWNGANEKTTLVIEILNGGTADLAEITLGKGSFTTYTINVTGANANTQINVAAKDAASNRFFIDSFKVTTQSTLGTIDYTEASKAVANTLWTNTASFNVKDQANVEVYNINGQLVKSFQVKGTQTVNVSDLVKGVYVVKTTSNGKTSTQKVVKK
ncbi:Por secretion system C-terminal sorting domain-containing protein [Chishuiella changwenlii]|uniref:Por secretion system C-terminal sorting domain-containing protein n=1 Tax=Chishuiella changwenlii TaxID=1434701 RepID=A0A1M6X1I5_9FLAO|nr:T9SS type A sorting domain-containing protein [Chishuiella changwenlii]GGE98434.1 hypothetical protein GCM10010984_15040 [Chishuiella changwenlii]SHK99784.1 Por secretion system C-terminal sorting domain-containing protein [Chishuiella changwenlii]